MKTSVLTPPQSKHTQLTRYASSGRLEIDNNVAERSMRAPALGRKNWLFAGSMRGGKAASRLSLALGKARTLTLRVIVVPKANMPEGREDSTELDNAVWARPLLIR